MRKRGDELVEWRPSGGMRLVAFLLAGNVIVVVTALCFLIRCTAHRIA